MKSIFIFHRDLRLYDNTTLIYADQLSHNIIPIFIFDPYQLNNKNKSDNCVQFMIESLEDLQVQMHKNNSNLYTYYGKPWIIIDQLLSKGNIECVYENMDYTFYHKHRTFKISRICQKHKVDYHTEEDYLLNNIETIKTSTNKFYEKFTPYYDNAKTHKIKEPNNYKFKNLISKYISPIQQFKQWNTLYVNNPNIYVHGGRQNALKILKQIDEFKNYNETKDEPQYDTTLLSAHNKFGTVSIREVYHTIKNKLKTKSELLRQLYWRDFYYNQIFYNEDYFNRNIGKYAKIKWKYDSVKWNKWKNGNTGIPIVDAGMKQLNQTGWIHNRVRMLVATTLTKILHLDWRLGETYFQKKLIDYDVSQNICNWYWVAGEAVFSQPYFRVLNPVRQTEKNDKECKYTKRWIKTDNCKHIEYENIEKDIKKSIDIYRKY